MSLQVGLQVGVDLMLEADQAQLREKSMALGSLFLALVEQVRDSFVLIE